MPNWVVRIRWNLRKDSNNYTNGHNHVKSDKKRQIECNKKTAVFIKISTIGKKA